jgi:hypothetical protein
MQIAFPNSFLGTNDVEQVQPVPAQGKVDVIKTWDW